MKRSNLIPITRIYDIYPKYTYSDDVKKFMDEIVDIDRANVYTKDDMVAMLTDFLMEIEENTSINSDDSHERNGKRLMRTEIIGMFEQKINSLKEDGK